MAKNSFLIDKSLSFNPTTAPSNPAEGDMYKDVTDGKVKQYKNSGWLEIGSGNQSPDFLLSQDFEQVSLSNFTQTGLELVSTSLISGTKTARLIHQPSSSYYFKEIKEISNKFKGRNVTLNLFVRSTAQSANLTLTVNNETTPSTIISSQISTNSSSFSGGITSGSPTISNINNSSWNSINIGASITGSGIPTGSIVIDKPSFSTITISSNATATATATLRVSELPSKRTFSFNIPQKCSSISYTVTALQESGLPETYIDDISVEMTETMLQSTSITVPTSTEHETIVARTTASSFNTVGGTDTIVPFATTEASIGTYTISSSAITIQKSGKYKVTLKGEIFGNGESVTYKVKVGGVNRFVSPVTHSIDVNGSGSWAHFSDSFITDLVASNIIDAYINMTNARPAKNFEIHLELQPVITNASYTIPLTSSVLVTQPDSYFQMNGFSVAAGSTGTRILSLASPTYTKSEGNAIKYVKDSVNGDYIEALLDGQYSLGFNYDSNLASTTNSGLGLSKNSNQLTTEFQSINPEHQLAMSYTLDVARISWVGVLKSGDKVRIHSGGGHLASAGTVYSQFSVSYQGSTKILNPSSDQKIEIPTHELRFEGASSRGSTDTMILKFDNLSKIKGDGFTISNTTTNGTVITINKAGLLTVSTAFGLTANNNAYVTKNSSQLTIQPTIPNTVLSFSSSEANGLQYVNMDWTGNVEVGDTIRVHATANPSMTLSSLNLILQETSVAVALQNIAPRWDNGDSCISVNTSNGLGTNSGNKVLRFANLQQNFGSAIEYTSSSTLGDSFLIKENGLYDVSFTNITTLAEYFCISVNNPDLTSVMNSIPIVNVLANGTTDANNYPETISTQVYLSKGDIVRAQSNGASVSSVGSTVSRFSIAKVGKTQGTVDVTPFVQIPQFVQDNFVSQTANGFGSTATTYYRWSNPIKNTNNGVLQWVSDPVNGDYFKALTSCSVSGSFNANFGTTNPYTHVAVWNSNLTLQIYAASTIQGYSSNGTQEWSNPFNVKLSAGEVIRFSFSGTTPTFAKLSVVATASSSSIATPTEQMSSDTILWSFKSTAIVDSDPVGTFNVLTYVANSGSATISATPPTQSVSSMNASGIQITARTAYTNATSATSPSRVAIKIGKGLSSVNLFGFISANKTTSAKLDFHSYGTAFNGLASKEYDPTTGILILDAGKDVGPTSYSWNFFSNADAGGSSTSVYVAFNASKSPSLVAIPNLQQRVAYISDVKGPNIEGGASIVGTQTRDLNTIVDNTGVVTSLASNQFTLSAGTYQIEASVPSYSCNRNMAYLRNITDSTNPLIGTGEYSAPGGYASVRSVIAGEITISSPKTFAIWHYTSAVQASNGLGLHGNSGLASVYTQVKIVKIK